MAAEEQRARKRWVPMPPTYLWAAIVLMVALHLLCPWVKWLIPQPYNYLGAVLIAGGIALSWLPELRFKKVGTEIKPFRVSSHLLTDGLFRVSRNPMYLGMAVVLAGVFVALASLTPVFVIPVFIVVMLVRFIIPEERHLEEQFGDDYREYKRRVRRWL